MRSANSASIAVRIQDLDFGDQCLVLARLVEARVATRRFAGADMVETYEDIGLPAPAKISNVFAALERSGLLSRTSGRGAVWRLSPKGRTRSISLVGEMDLAQVAAEALSDRPPSLGSAIHPVIPPSLAPPELLGPLSQFLAEHPFETNVFGMTRFPDEQDDVVRDPVAAALEVARNECAGHGLEFHLASDRAIADDLWTNVAGHMWASRYGVAFFEDRRGRGLNYNLTIEVGSMLMSGRRCALLRDSSISHMPTDLVGKIYKAVDLEDPESVSTAIKKWIENDLVISDG
jgi:hypothetical protein